MHVDLAPLVAREAQSLLLLLFILLKLVSRAHGLIGRLDGALDCRQGERFEDLGLHRIRILRPDGTHFDSDILKPFALVRSPLVPLRAK